MSKHREQPRSAGGLGGTAQLIAVRALFLLVLLCALCAGLHTVADGDAGWHLATGRWVVQHRQVPRTDVLSFTSVGQQWTYPPLGEVIFYLLYRVFGYAGLSWFCALACVAVVAYLIRNGDLASTLLAMLAIGSIATRTGARPDLFSTLFFALVLGELWAFHRGMRARIWLLPVLMVLWVNCHPGFIAGLGAMAVYLLMEAGDLLLPASREAAKARLRKSLRWLAASVVVTLINPWGPKIYTAAVGFLGPAGSSQGKLNGSVGIAEFRPVPLSTHMLYQLIDVRHAEFGFTWLLLLAVIVAGLFLWNRQVGSALVVLAALYAALSHVRYSALFAITVATLGPAVLGKLSPEVITAGSPRSSPALSRTSSPRSSSPLVLPLVVLFCALAGLQIYDYVSNRTYVVFNPDLRFGAGAASWFPQRAADFILREHLPGNVFEDYELGGFAAWSLGPKYPDFIDGRGNNPDLVIEQFKLYSEDPDSQAWQNEADRWNLNVLLVATAGLRGMNGLDVYRFCQSNAWRPVYMDDVSLVFLRNTANNSSWISRLQIDCSSRSLTPPVGVSRAALQEFYVNTGELLFLLHRDRAAEEALHQADGLFRQDPNVHLLQGLLYERGQQYAAAEEEFRASLGIHENSGVWYSLGRIYGNQGRNEEALNALEHAAGLALQPFNIYMTMGKLQIVLNRPQDALESFAKAEKTSLYRNGAESLAPEAYAELAESRSEAYRRLEDWKQAIAFQQEAVKLTPAVARRWDRLARLYEAVGQRKEADEARRRVIELQGSGNQDAGANR